jgi:hypothetical protein
VELEARRELMEEVEVKIQVGMELAHTMVVAVVAEVVTMEEEEALVELHISSINLQIEDRAEVGQAMFLRVELQFKVLDLIRIEVMLEI